MHWRLKGAIQKVLGVLPGGEHLHYELQKRAGGLKNFESHVRMKVEDWSLMAGHLASAGMPIEGKTFFEIGSGWFPALPFCLYLGGAKSVITVDLNRHMRPELLRKLSVHVGDSIEVIAKASGQDVAKVTERQRSAVRALERGASLDEATQGVVRYRAPSDAADSGEADESLDVMFSNSVLEHIPGPVIAKIFAEGARLVKPGSVMFHSVNCGDHYAYADSKVTQVNYLQYGDAEWARNWDNAFLYQNRLRSTDFTRMAREAGFAIELDTSRPHPKHVAAIARMRVHPDFARYSPDELAITSIDFIARKPARN